MGVKRFGPTEVESAADSAEEWAFLCAISENYLDEVPKLVYADWLEERGDARGHFLREFVRLARDPQAMLPEGEEFPRVWRDVTGLRPTSLIRKVLLTEKRGADIEREILKTLRPAVYFTDKAKDDAKLPPGCTKYGGLPDLPPGVAWPGDPSGEAYIFCAQIRLSNLHGFVATKELPREGLLSFFYDPRGAAVPPVLFHPEAGPLSRPSALPTSRVDGMEEHYPLPSGRMRATEGSDLYREWEKYIPWPNEISPECYDAICQVAEELTESNHQLLGNGKCFSTGGEPPGKRRLAEFGHAAKKFYWGDSNNPIWCISEADLTAGLFDKAECYGG